MLAYELYQINKNSTRNNPKTQLPIKKIFYKNNQIIIDSKTIEQYGSEKTKQTQQLQNFLEMPLNTIDATRLNLPDFRTGAASANPYIEIYGTLATNKLGSKLSITIGKKQNRITHILDLSDGKITEKVAKNISLKLNKKDYFIGSNNLFMAYVDSGIIDQEGHLNIKIYHRIAQQFLKFAKKQEPNITEIGKVPFRLFILPDDKKIQYKQFQKEQNEEKNPSIDFFGNTYTDYPSSRAKSAKFLTFDDPAFAINCKQGKNFYKNLGIGNTTLEKIYIDKAKIFTINRLVWAFIDISDPDYKFVEIKQGILTRLHENYRIISKDKGMTKKTLLKIICVKINQSKQEILLDTNLTMDVMKKMFMNINNIPKLCLEIFIDDSNENPVWDMYIYVVRNFLAGNSIPKDRMLAYFNKILKQNRYGWIKLNDSNSAQEFFVKSDFCLKSLYRAPDKVTNMATSNEDFAEKIGQIVRVYIDFKQKNNENDNSLSDILTYSKYDREKLRFVLSRVGRGIELSKISENEKKKINDTVTSLQPKEEIMDNVAANDFSYFFFKGYYTKRDIKT